MLFWCKTSLYLSITEGMKSTASWRRSERATRVRTVLSETQLRMLQTCYSANPRPDALMKEQLVEMTGLSPRVIRVWFQNKRCKDKKRSLMMRHTQKQLEGHLVSEQVLTHSRPCSRIAWLGWKLGAALLCSGWSELIHIMIHRFLIELKSNFANSEWFKGDL